MMYMHYLVYINFLLHQFLVIANGGWMVTVSACGSLVAPVVVMATTPAAGLITATWCCRNNFSQWERSFLWKLRCHWLKELRQRQIVVVRQGPAVYTCAFQTGCQLSSAASGMSLELRFLAQSQWHEANVLDNWQLPQSGGREFDPRRVHDNLSVPLWVYMCFPVPEHPN